MDKPIFPQGIVCFKKHDKAPDFVIGQMVINLDDFKAWINTNQHLLTEYNGKKQLKLNMTYSKNDQRPTVSVDTWKPKADTSDRNEVIEPSEDLPF